MQTKQSGLTHIVQLCLGVIISHVQLLGENRQLDIKY